MSNSSYLCCWNESRLYPSQHEKFDSRENTLAIGTYTVPLLWLSMFNKKDWRTQELVIGGERVTGEGPVTSVELALENLGNAQACLLPLFYEYGLTEEPFRCLAKYIEPFKGNFITVEIEEIAMMHPDEDRYYEKIKVLLNGLSMGAQLLNESRVSSFKAGLIEFMEFKKPINFYPLRAYSDSNILNEDDYRNFEILLGGELYRRVPWWDSAPSNLAHSSDDKLLRQHEMHGNLGKIFIFVAILLFALIIIMSL